MLLNIFVETVIFFSGFFDKEKVQKNSIYFVTTFLFIAYLLY